MCRRRGGSVTSRTQNLTNDENGTSKFGGDLRNLQKAVSRRRQGQAIGEALRNQFESLVAEPLPDHLLDLLNELERREGES
jgi:hypothetical protein